MRRIRLSRPCYDKFHRCPGWIGGGPHWAKRERCDNGHIRYGNGPDDRLWRWKFLPCDTCNVVVWPYMTRYLSVFWLAHKAEIWWRYADHDTVEWLRSRTLCRLGWHSRKASRLRGRDGVRLCRWCRLVVSYDSEEGENS